MDSIWFIIAFISSLFLAYYIGKLSVLNEKMEYFMTVMDNLAKYCKEENPKK